MILYSIIMFITAAVMIVLGRLVYNGNAELIHSYHQTRVTDKKGYGKAMGKAIAGVSIPLILSGIAALFTATILLTVILIVGLVVSFIPLFFVQKKYNGGVF